MASEQIQIAGVTPGKAKHGTGKAPSANTMTGELNSSQAFRAWLLTHARQDTAIGDVARDAKQDPCLGRVRTPSEILHHIETEHEPSEAFLDAFSEAVAKWAAVR